MQDPRISQLAQQFVRYSTNSKKGEEVLLHLVDVPGELAGLRNDLTPSVSSFIGSNTTEMRPGQPIPGVSQRDRCPGDR